MAIIEQKISQDVQFLKDKVLAGKALIGSDSVLKGLRKKSVSKIYLASNCPAKSKEEIQHYAGLAKVPIVILELNNEELGIVCKKSFFISALGIIGE